MPQIYKPLKQFMVPCTNDIIDPSVSNNFSAQISGQTCIAYRLNVYDMDNVNVLTTNRVSLASMLYNGDILTHTVAANSLVAGNEYKWNIDLYANDKVSSISVLDFPVSSVDIDNNYMVITETGDNKVLTGDGVCVSSTTTVPSPLESGTVYYAARSVDASDNVCIFLYNNRAEALSGGVSIVITDIGSGTISMKKIEPLVCNNHNFETGDSVYVSVIPTELSSYINAYQIYYVRKISNNQYCLYEYLEGARNDVGRLPILATAGSYNLTVSNVVQSDYVVFKSYNNPVLTLTGGTISAPIYTAAPIYTHPQGIIVNFFKVTITNDFNDEVIESGVIYRSKLEYEYDAFISGHNYYIKFDVTNSIGQEISTGYMTFLVSYGTVNMTLQLDANNIENGSCVQLTWPKLVDISGTVVGTSEYIENYVVTGNYGLHLSSDTQLVFSEINKSEDGSLPMFGWSPASSDWSGTIFTMRNTTTDAYVSVRYSNGIFYKNVNGTEVAMTAKVIEEFRHYTIGFIDDAVVIIDGAQNAWVL